MSALPFHRILVPTDFSPCSSRAADLAARIARACGAPLVLQHASEVPDGLHADDSIHPSRHGARVGVDAYAREGAGARLAREAARLRGTGDDLEVTTRVDLGPVEASILRAAEETRADLVVMGTHGRTGWRRGLLGSVTEDVLRRSMVATLVLRSDDDADPLTAEEHQLDAERQG
jgi:nucleotide-binding universal stress UspA family protein